MGERLALSRGWKARNTEPKCQLGSCKIVGGFFGPHSCRERLGALEKSLIVGQRERLQRRVAAQPARAGYVAARGIKCQQHGIGTGSPEVRVHPAAIALAALGGVPGLGILRE